MPADLEATKPAQPPAELKEAAGVLTDGLGLRGYACHHCSRLGFHNECLAGRCIGRRHGYR